MAFVQSQLDALDLAIASGQRSYTVQYADRSESRVYHTLAEMLDLRAQMAAEIAGAVVDGVLPRPRAWFLYSTKGF